jgi:hypothetical protein
MTANGAWGWILWCVENDVRPVEMNVFSVHGSPRAPSLGDDLDLRLEAASIGARVRHTVFEGRYRIDGVEWDRIAARWDAVRFEGGFHLRGSAFRTWGCESTAWIRLEQFLVPVETRSTADPAHPSALNML